MLTGGGGADGFHFGPLAEGVLRGIASTDVVTDFGRGADVIVASTHVDDLTLVRVEEAGRIDGAVVVAERDERTEITIDGVRDRIALEGTGHDLTPGDFRFVLIEVFPPGGPFDPLMRPGPRDVENPFGPSDPDGIVLPDDGDRLPGEPIIFLDPLLGPAGFPDFG